MVVLYDIWHSFLIQGLLTMALVILSLLTVKTVFALPYFHSPRFAWRYSAGVVILVLTLWGGYGIGCMITAEVSHLAGQRALEQGNKQEAYRHCIRAIRYRPGEFRYWQHLTSVKMALRQFSSALGDKPAYLELTAGRLEPSDEYRFATCHFFRADIEAAEAILDKLVQENPHFPAPQLLLGMTYAAQANFIQAEAEFLEVLQRFPNHPLAVEKLAQVLYLQDRKRNALQLLRQTRKIPFPASLHQHFDELILLYGEKAAPPQLIAGGGYPHLDSLVCAYGMAKPRLEP